VANSGVANSGVANSGVANSGVANSGVANSGVASSEAADLGKIDPGRVAARALISRQGALRNVPGPYGYAGIDGRPVPQSMVVVHPLPPGVTELIIATDGYPEIHPTLARSEARLTELLAEDPGCVGALMGTKGLTDGQLSYDDRAYLRLRI
jgi:pentapeptide repeat protein